MQQPQQGSLPPSEVALPFGSLPPSEVEEELIRYLEEGYASDTPLSAEQVRLMLLSASGPLSWTTTTEDKLTVLHLAAMAEASTPQEVFSIVSLLLQAGAPPQAKDMDGDTPLEAVLSLAEDGDGNDDADGGTEKHSHMAAVCALISSPALPIERPEILKICSWLRRHMPKGRYREQVLQCLVAKAGDAEVKRTWASEELLEYLEHCAYDKKRGVNAQKVADLLARGAMPSHMQNGATALLLVVLNPYSSYLELEKVFRLMLSKDPIVATIRDAFKLSPFQWAADFSNVAAQHGLKRPNPAALLALLPAVLELLPPDLDAGDTGIACLKVSPSGSSTGVPEVAKAAPDAEPRPRPPVPRFLEGDRVVCRVEVPGGGDEWEEGVVIGTWYRESIWPSEFPGAPYEVRLDLGSHVYVLGDHDHLIRREVKVKGEKAVVAASPTFKLSGYAADFVPPVDASAKPAATAKGKPAGGSRFVRRQREDGKWEMFDTVSGRARLIADESDSDDD